MTICLYRRGVTPIQARRWWRARRSIVAALLIMMAWPFSAAMAVTAAEAVELAAPYALLMDAQSGRVLYEKNGYEPTDPASMSKIMTLIMVFDALKRDELKLDDEILITEDAWRRGGAASGSSTMFADVGSFVPVEALISGIAVQSGNDASIAIADALSGSEASFAAAMSERGREIGLTQSTFANATGWPHEDHKMSAYDLALAARYTIYAHANYYDFYAGRSFTWNDIRQPNRNTLLGKAGIDGLKTGHTTASGYGLTASAQRDGWRLISVVNGLESATARNEATLKLLDWGFRLYDRYVFAEADKPVGEVEAWACQPETLAVVAGQRISIPLQRRLRDAASLEIVYDKPLQAPIAPGDEVAILEIMVPGEEAFAFPLYAATELAAPGLLKCWGRQLYHFAFGWAG